jgi:hypothetical protein
VFPDLVLGQIIEPVNRRTGEVRIDMLAVS